MKAQKVTVLLILACFLALQNRAPAQGTAFTYQGRLTDSGGPANGLYDFSFLLTSDSADNNIVGGPVVTNGLAVTNGLFMASLDFGGGVFTGPEYWLEIGVRTNGAASYSTILPLQPVTPTPYALFATSASNFLGTVPALQLTGVLGSTVLPGFQGPDYNVIGGGNGNIENPPNYGETIAGGFANSALQTYSTVAGGGYNTSSGFASFVGAGFENVASNEYSSVVDGYYNLAGGIGSFVGGGGFDGTIYGGNYAGGGGAVIGGGVGNTNLGPDSAIVAGLRNSLQSGAYDDFIGTGSDNRIYGDRIGYGSSAIVAGEFNYIYYNATGSFVGAGFHNSIGGDPYDAGSCVVVGGFANSIVTNSPDSFIGGGHYNNLYGDPQSVGNSVIVGGWYNGLASAMSVIGGGQNNAILGDSGDVGGSVIGGGSANNISSDCQLSVITGGKAISSAGVPIIRSWAAAMTI